MLGKHQLAAILSTAMDFTTMVLVVELLGASSVAATFLGASAGGATNFTIGRLWTFRASSGPVGPQALRYVLVSASSAGWNAVGEYVLNVRLGLQYIAARALVAILVSMLWNFPLQRWFVFRGAVAAPARGGGRNRGVTT